MKFKILNEKSNVRDVIQELARLRSQYTRWIENEVQKQFSSADSYDDVPEKDLEKIVDGVRSKVERDIVNANVEELEILGIKITSKIAKQMADSYRNGKGNAHREYGKGWSDCYDFLKENGLLK